MNENMHEKIMESCQEMLIDLTVNLPYYGNFLLFMNFIERKDLPTCAVNITAKGMNFYYNSKFLDGKTQKEVNFIVIHEIFHLLWSHPKRTMTGQYEHKLANIAQDMIINHIIWEDIAHSFIDIPKDAKGRNMTLFVPKEYKGGLIFEEIYEWLRDERDKRKKQNKCQNSTCQSCNGTGKKQQQQQGQQQQQQPQGGGQQQQKQQQGQQGQPQQGQGQGEGEQEGQGQGQQPGQGQGQGQQPGQGQGGGGGSQPGSGRAEQCPDCNGTGAGETDSAGNPSYGKYGKMPSKREKDQNGTIDTYSLDHIFDNMDETNGEYLDHHMGDEVPEEMREAVVKDVMDRLRSRGFEENNVTESLNKLRKKRKDYLSHIKRSLSAQIFGSKKQKTITKPNRRGIIGLKGNRKVKTKITVILDTSGSMGGTFERVLSYIYRNDIEMNLIEADTNVKWIQNIKNKKQLESMPIKGLGGTILQPAIDVVAEKFNDTNLLVLTDGFCDSLDVSKIRGNVLMISIDVKVPISVSNGRLKQIIVGRTDK
jgi:predicted metal-dependent peptidase